jgi:hypothetical protein
MPSSRYNPFCIEGTLKPTLPDPFRAPLCLFSFKSFFSLFTPSLLGNITVLNTPFTYSAVSSSFTLMPTTLNHYICRAITHFNRWERCKEQE